MTNFNTKKMATAIATLTVSALLIAPAVHARGPANADRLQAHFDRIDTSGDGVIDSTEWSAKAANHAEHKFNRKDADDDGFLTLEEATTTRRGEARDFSDIADDIVQCVADLKEETGDENIMVPDADHFLSPEDKFDNVDTSGDGLLDLDEALAKASEKSAESFDNLDSDNNGLVTFEEFSAGKDKRHATRRAVKSCIDELTIEDDLV